MPALLSGDYKRGGDQAKVDGRVGSEVWRTRETVTPDERGREAEETGRQELEDAEEARYQQWLQQSFETRGQASGRVSRHLVPLLDMGKRLWGEKLQGPLGQGV